MGRRLSDATHTPWIAALLAASLLLVGLLAINAGYAARSHRAVAEGVLRDYAALAGDDLLRRVAAEIGYYGHLQALEALRREAANPDAQRREAPRTKERAQSPMQLVSWAFTLNPTTRKLTPLREHPGETVPNLADWLSKRGPPALAASSEGDLAVLQRGPATYVLGPLDAASGPDAGPSGLIGFELDRTHLRPRIAQVLDRRPLLPASLGGGALGNEVLYLRLTDASGDELLQRGERYAEALRVERTLPPDYLQPLAGLEIEVAVDPAAASRLVIGGLPRSRLPILLSLVALTGGLFTAALVLLRRERAVAHLRTDFVSRVSHELRTPLTQIRMFAETLRLGRVRDDAERDRALEIIDRESRRLSGLVENILQLSRSERGAARLAPGRLMINRFLADLVGEVQSLLAGDEATREVRIELQAPDEIELVADSDALRQSLLNLLDNAVKYGPAAQTIIVGAEERAEGVRLWVEDAGPGIAPADRERVWRAFRRIDSAGASGTGIGLAVVRDLVRLHGGTCWVETGRHGGARVVLELPPAPPKGGGA